MLKISKDVAISSGEIDVQAIRAQGSGGQNVNKVSTAIHLRFDIKSSSLPDSIKEKLLILNDQRISEDGVVIIKAQRFRSQLKNKEDALKRLQELIKSVIISRKKRKVTQPTKGSQERRLESKIKRGQTKSLRGKVDDQ